MEGKHWQSFEYMDFSIYNCNLHHSIVIVRLNRSWLVHPFHSWSILQIILTLLCFCWIQTGAIGIMICSTTNNHAASDSKLLYIVHTWLCKYKTTLCTKTFVTGQEYLQCDLTYWKYRPAALPQQVVVIHKHHLLVFVPNGRQIVGSSVLPIDPLQILWIAPHIVTIGVS